MIELEFEDYIDKNKYGTLYVKEKDLDYIKSLWKRFSRNGEKRFHLEQFLEILKQNNINYKIKSFDKSIIGK